jgi:hypothetical protein
MHTPWPSKTEFRRTGHRWLTPVILAIWEVPEQIVCETPTPISEITEQNGLEVWLKAVERLLCKCKALSSNSGSSKKKKKKKSEMSDHRLKNPAYTLKCKQLVVQGKIKYVLQVSVTRFFLSLTPPLSRHLGSHHAACLTFLPGVSTV